MTMKNYLVFFTAIPGIGSRTANIVKLEAPSDDLARLRMKDLVKHPNEITGLARVTYDLETNAEVYRIIPQHSPTTRDVLEGYSEIGRAATEAREMATDIKLMCEGGLSLGGLAKHCDEIIRNSNRILEFASGAAALALAAEDPQDELPL